MQDSINYNQIIKDCFWDYNIDANDISEILNSNDLRRKQKLFSKIIYNSTDKARTLQSLFEKEMLQQLFDTFAASYNKMDSGEYAGAHWLASFALYALVEANE